MAKRKDGTLSDRDIINYLSERAYVECTDWGNEDPARFAHPDMYPGDFRQAISQHIHKIRAGLIQTKPTPDEDA